MKQEQQQTHSLSVPKFEIDLSRKDEEFDEDDEDEEKDEFNEDRGEDDDDVCEIVRETKTIGGIDGASNIVTGYISSEYQDKDDEDDTNDNEDEDEDEDDTQSTTSILIAVTED